MATMTPGYAVLPISASLLGMTDELRTQLVGPTQKAAKQAGANIRKEMSDGVDQAAKNVEKANFRIKRAAEEQLTAESRLAEQKLKTEAAVKAVESAARKRADAEGKGIDAIEKAEQDLLKKRAQAEKAARDLAAAEGKVESALSESARATKSLADRQADLDKANGDSEKSSKKFRDRLREMGDEAESTGGIFEGMGGKIAGWAGGLAGVIGVGAFAGMGKALASETSLINMQLGYTGDAAAGVGESIKEALSSGVAGSAEEAANAIGALESQWKYLGSEGEQTAGELADNFLAFSKVFEVDMAEATQTAGQLITNGLASDVESAADMMTTAMQRVPAQMRDELPEIINEYGVNFANLGLSGEEAFSLLISQAENGKIALDKTGDALKEFSLFAIDPAKAEAFESIGINAADMATAVAEGGDAAQQALQDTATKLLDIEDPGVRAAKAVELFGTPLEDLGVEGIPAFLQSLTGVEDGMAGFEGSSQAAADTIANSLDGRLNALKGTVQGLAGDAFMWVWELLEDDLIPAFKDLGGWVQDNEKWLAPLSVAVGGIATGMIAWTAATKAYTFAQGLATGAFKLFDSVTKKSWIGLLVTAIAGLVAGLVWFFRETELGQEIWGNFTAFLSETWENVSEVFGNVVENIKEWWSGLTSDLSEGWESLKSGVFDAWNSTVEGVKTGWSDFTGMISGAWQSTKDTFVATWEGIKTLVFMAWEAYVNQVKANWDMVTGAITGAWNLLKDGFIWAWETIKNAVFLAFTSTTNQVKAGWDTVTTALGNSWTWVKDTLGAGWDWIRDNVFSKFTDTIGSVRDRFSGFVDALGDKWSGLKSLLAKPINFMINTVYNDGILRAWNIIAGILPGLDKGNPLAGIPEHATGGRISGPGTGTSDDVLMWGSNGEHMWTAREVQQLGGHGAMYAMRDAVDSGRPFTFDGQGGVAILPKTDERAGDLAGAAPHLLIPGFAEGGAIRPMWEMQLENGHRAAKMRNGNPYTWGHEDCSGYMSMIADAIINGGDGVRRWATGSFPGGQPWVPGLGAGFSVGVHDNPGGPGGGHTAGTLTGVGNYMTTNVESGGSPSLVKYGVGAAGADSPQFRGMSPGQFHLAIGADGAFESGGAGGGVDPGVMRGWISEKLGGVVDTIMAPLVSQLPQKPPEWQGIPRGVYDSGRDSMVEGIAEGVAGLTDGLATVWNAVRSIPDLVRDALGGDKDVEDAARATLFDSGGVWKSGTAGVNLSGADEYVFTNKAMRGFTGATESLQVISKELSTAFLGGDWGYGELASVLGNPEVAEAIVNGASALGTIAREVGPVAADAGRGFLESQATSILDVVGLGGLVPMASSFADEHGPALAESARSLLGGDISVSGGITPGGATVIIEAESDEDLVRVGQLKALADHVQGLDVQVNAKKRPPAAAVTRGGVM